MTFARAAIIVGIGTIFAPGLAFAQFESPFGGSSDEEKPHATMRLAVETERLTPGEAEIAVVFEIDDQWHLYWENSGDTGLPPAVEFEWPDGVEPAGDLEWPAPRRYIHGGGQLLDYIYEDAFALIQPVRIDPALAGETVEITATGSWLVCKEACLPGDGAATLSIAVGQTPGAPTADADLIAASRERVPHEAGELGLEASWDGLDLVVRAGGASRMELFPLEPALGGPADPITDGVGFGDELRVRYDEKVDRAERVVAVVGVSRDGATRFARLALAPPGARARE